MIHENDDEDFLYDDEGWEPYNAEALEDVPVQREEPRKMSSTNEPLTIMQRRLNDKRYDEALNAFFDDFLGSELQDKARFIISMYVDEILETKRMRTMSDVAAIFADENSYGGIYARTVEAITELMGREDTYNT